MKEQSAVSDEFFK